MKKLSIAIVFLCALAAVCHAEERWALLVGIDEYASDIITPLKGAAHDARALRDMLIEYARFPSDNIFCLTSDDEANLPNLGNIVTKLDYIASEARQGDIFLFFFAGHGIFLNDQNYLLAYESDIRPFLLTKTALSVEELNGYLGKIQSGNTILILDACRNNPGAGRGDEDNLMTDGFVKSVEDIHFRATIYACNTGQRAYEWPGKGRGFFSITLGEALRGKADNDSNGEVTLNEMGLYLVNRVPDLVRRELGGSRTQIPRVDMSGDPRAGDMVLSWAVEGQQESKPVEQDAGETIASRDLKASSDQPPSDETEDSEAEPIQQSSEEMNVTVGPESETTSQLTPADQARQKASDAFAELDWEVLDAEDDGQPDQEETPKPGPEPLTEQQKAEGWVDATGECYGENITPSDAQQIALERARRNAIETALGAEMCAQGVLMRSVEDFHRSFIALNQFGFSGEIVEEAEPIWGPVENIQIRPGDPPVPLHRVKLRARVVKEESQPDPGFSVSLRLNNMTFLEGEEMILSITPTQDCYITVFNILSDHTVLILDHALPIVPGKQTSFVPTEAQRESGKHFLLALPEGSVEEMESIIVVATRDNVPFMTGEVKEPRSDVAVTGEKDVLGVLPTYQSALEEINCWLVSIPAEKRAFDIQQYKIKTSL